MFVALRTNTDSQSDLRLGVQFGNDLLARGLHQPGIALDADVFQKEERGRLPSSCRAPW